MKHEEIYNVAVGDLIFIDPSVAVYEQLECFNSGEQIVRNLLFINNQGVWATVLERFESPQRDIYARIIVHTSSPRSRKGEAPFLIGWIWLNACTHHLYSAESYAKFWME